MAPSHRPCTNRRPDPRSSVYVVPFEGEGPRDYSVTTDTDGVKVHGVSIPAEVDPLGITWEPWGGEQTGRQRYDDHHPARQRNCMENLLCGGCGEQPDDQPQFGMLWILSRSAVPRRWPCEILTPVPPFCEPCAQRAARECHGLRDGFMRVRASVSQTVGVAGELHLPGCDPEDRTVLFNDGLVRFVIARQLVRRLEFVRPDPLLPGGPTTRGQRMKTTG